MIDSYDEHDRNGEHADNQIEHEIEVSAEGKRDCELHVREGCERKGKIIAHGQHTVVLLWSEELEVAEVHPCSDEPLPVRVLLIVIKAQLDGLWYHLLLASTLFRSYREDLEVGEVSGQEVIVVDWLNRYVKERRAAFNFEPTRQRLLADEYLIVDAVDLDFFTGVSSRRHSEAVFGHPASLLTSNQVTGGVLLHQRPEWDEIAIASTVGEVREKR